MLGLNFSFGDYFNNWRHKVCLEFFLTEELKLPKENYWLRSTQEDDEALIFGATNMGCQKHKSFVSGNFRYFCQWVIPSPAVHALEIFLRSRVSTFGEALQAHGRRRWQICRDMELSVYAVSMSKLNGIMHPYLSHPSIRDGLERNISILQHVFTVTMKSIFFTPLIGSDRKDNWHYWSCW